MRYNPDIPRSRYDNYEDREWTRLEKDGHGALLYEVHAEMLRRYVRPEDRVLEIGAGSGRYTKDLVTMCAALTVADLSPHQIAFNQAKMKELSLLERVGAFHVLDVLDMGILKMPLSTVSFASAA